MRFYFDTRDNGILQPDEVGEEFLDIEGAIAHARQRYGEALRGPGVDGHEPSFRVEIRSGDDAPSFILDASTANMSA